VELILLTCAESCVIDLKTNRLSIFHVMEQIGSPTFPLALPKFTLVVMLSKTRREPQKVLLPIHFTLDKQSLANLHFELDFQDKIRARGIAEIQGLVIPGPGKLQATLKYKNEELGIWEIQADYTGKPKLVPKASASAAAVSPADSAPKASARKAAKKKSK